MNKSSRDTPITTTVAALSDQHLLQQVKELSAIEHYVQGVVIDHLREVERRGLYLALGFSGMFDYVRELGYSTGAAWRRLKAMRLCEEVKGARGRLLEGTLTLDAAAQLQHAFERQERKARRSTTRDTDQQAGRGKQADAGSAMAVMELGAWTADAPGGSAPDGAARAAEPEGAEGAPSGLVPDAPERPVAPVLDAAARELLVAEATGKSTRQVKEMLAKVDPELARAADRMRPLGAGRWELKAVIDDDCQVGLEQLKGLLSHVDPQMTLGQLLGRVVREALDRHDPSRPPRRRGRSRRTPDVAGQNFGAENSGRAGRRGGAAERHAGGLRDFGAESAGGRRPAPRYGCEAACGGRPDRGRHGGDFGAERGCGGAADRASGRRGDFASQGSGRGPARGSRRNRRFGAEGRRWLPARGASERPARHAGDCTAAAARPPPRYSRGGQAAGVGARPGLLQLRGPGQWAPVRLPASAGDRSRRTVCARR